MKKTTLAVIFGFLTLGLPLRAEPEFPFYVFENGLRFGTLQEEAAAVKAAGYDGIGSARPTSVAARRKACEEAGIKLISLYVGSKIMKELITESDEKNVTLSLHVEHNNPAMGLYENLGFVKKDLVGIYFFMERQPGSRDKRQKTEDG